MFGYGVSFILAGWKIFFRLVMLTATATGSLLVIYRKEIYRYLCSSILYLGQEKESLISCNLALRLTLPPA